MVQCYGVDAGYGWTKLVGSGQKFKYVSMVGTARELNLFSEKEGLFDNLHVKVDGKEYFIGELAQKESFDAGLVLDVTKIETSKILILVALALAGADKFWLTTGLPIAHYYAQKEYLKKALTGRFTVEFLEGAFKGKKVHLASERVVIVPQGAGAIFSQIFDKNGIAYPSDLTTKRIACIDIGYKTTDFLVMDGMAYVDQYSSSLPIGVVDVHKAFLKRSAEQGKEMLLSDVMSVPKELLEPEAKHIAEKILRNVKAFIGENISIYLAGGGAYLFEKFLQGQILPDAQYANAEGYYRMTKAWRSRDGR